MNNIVIVLVIVIKAKTSNFSNPGSHYDPSAFCDFKVDGDRRKKKGKKKEKFYPRRNKST